MKKYIALFLLLLVAAPMMAADFNLEQGLNDFINEMGFVTFFADGSWKVMIAVFLFCLLSYFVDLLIKKNSSTHSNVRRISKLLGMKNMEHKDYLRMLTGFEMTEEDDLKKPLSKMTRDLWKH